MITTEKRLSHKLGKDWGIVPIHLENKYSTKEFENIYTNINNTLFYFSYLYIGANARDYLLKEIENAGTKLKDINWPLSKGKRKDELLDKLRDIYVNVKKIPSYDSSNFDILEDKMSGYQVSKYLKDKKNGLTDEQKLLWIRHNKLFASIYSPNETLKSVQDELLKEFELN